MAGILKNIIRAVRGKDRKKLKDKAKNIVERDRVLYNKLVKAG